MKEADVRKLIDLPPRQRAAQLLDLGAELHKRLRKSSAAGTLPRPLKRESITQTVAAPLLKPLHGIPSAEPHKITGLSETGRRLRIRKREVVDLVLTPQARKQCARQAMNRTKSETVKDLAIRQLALGMLDSDSVARCCGAYAYWQATGADAAIPILVNGTVSKNEEERIIAAHCLAKISPQHVRRLQGTRKDDEPQTPVQPIKNSMTVIIHGTFAKDSAWYQPGGEFHEYIKKNVYPDVYSAPDFFFWSGRYALDDKDLKKIWSQAAKKLVSWCNSHPARMLRLIAHSHGNNVVNMVTQQVPACTLIQLSPPVRSWNLPDLRNVSSNRLFNIHSTIDTLRMDET